MSVLTTRDWHRRCQEQAAWTGDIRSYLYRCAGIAAAKRILEVGCGTGVITTELKGVPSAQVYGLDLAGDRLALASQFTPRASFIQGNALALPFANCIFDITLCHFLLLWLPHPQQALAEMARVTHPGGAILLLAEPDYGGRIDYPPNLARIGLLQAESLRRQGADPNTGRQLSTLLGRAGLTDIETGVLGGQWRIPYPADAAQSEWQMITDDLQKMLPATELAELRQQDQSAWQRGERILFVPTFYAWGRVPSGSRKIS